MEASTMSLQKNPGFKEEVPILYQILYNQQKTVEIVEPLVVMSAEVTPSALLKTKIL